MNTEKFTWKEKAILKMLAITAKDVQRKNSTCYGTWYELKNHCCVCEGMFNGYSRAEIYRLLARKLIAQIQVPAWFED